MLVCRGWLVALDRSAHLNGVEVLRLAVAVVRLEVRSFQRLGAYLLRTPWMGGGAAISGDRMRQPGCECRDAENLLNACWTGRKNGMGARNAQTKVASKSTRTRSLT